LKKINQKQKKKRKSGKRKKGKKKNGTAHIQGFPAKVKAYENNRNQRGGWGRKKKGGRLIQIDYNQNIIFLRDAKTSTKLPKASLKTPPVPLQQQKQKASTHQINK
jgi:hypothetical protein